MDFSFLENKDVQIKILEKNFTQINLDVKYDDIDKDINKEFKTSNKKVDAILTISLMAFDNLVRSFSG